MIILQIEQELDRFIKKCMENGINLYKIDYHKDYLRVKVLESDLENICRLNYYSKIEVVKVLGIKGKILHFKQYVYDYLMLFVFLFIIYLTSNVVVNVTIRHENKELIENVNTILIQKGITPFSLGKDLGELNKISETILAENRDTLDFISINKVGMKYIVSFEERILTKEKNKKKYCHVIAQKHGVISKIIAKSGVSNYEVGDYVNVGDILITGEILLNEDIKDNVCASGDIYAETWYKVNITVPFEYEEKEYTKKSRYNFILNGNYFYKKNYEHYDEEKVMKFKNFSIIKQKEYNLKTYKYSKEEAKTLGIEEAKKKLLEKIGKNNTIISQKVLKESANDSKIELEVFLSVNELISKQEPFEVGEPSDTE